MFQQALDPVPFPKGIKVERNKNNKINTTKFAIRSLNQV